MRFVIARFWRSFKCDIGLHADLVAYRDCGDGVNVEPLDNPYRHGPGIFRHCRWCGTRWKSVYDSIAPSWQRTA